MGESDEVDLPTADDLVEVETAEGFSKLLKFDDLKGVDKLNVLLELESKYLRLRPLIPYKTTSPIFSQMGNMRL